MTAPRFNFDFLARRRLAAMLSGALLLISLLSLVTRGLDLGLDFTGGTLIEAGYSEPVDLPEVREKLAAAGFDNASVQHFGTSREVLIRMPVVEGESSADLSTRVINQLNQGESHRADLRRVEFVGPQVGDELTQDGGLAMLYALIGVLVYVAWRFEYRFAVGSVAALAHDVVLTLGLFSVFGLEFDLTVLAAVLAVVGYSLNDTIVVFDRIRENFRKVRKGTPEEITNLSVNETLSRTLMTSLTTLLVLVALALLGGEIIHNFAIALIAGIVIGTYSSIFVASPVVIAMGISREDLLLPAKEGDDLDHIP